jgi:hypothetical protein
VGKRRGKHLQSELPIRGDDYLAHEVGVPLKSAARVAVLLLRAFPSQGPDQNGLVPGARDDHVIILARGSDGRDPVGVGLQRPPMLQLLPHAGWLLLLLLLLLRKCLGAVGALSATRSPGVSLVSLLPIQHPHLPSMVYYNMCISRYIVSYQGAPLTRGKKGKLGHMAEDAKGEANPSPAVFEGLESIESLEDLDFFDFDGGPSIEDFLSSRPEDLPFLDTEYQKRKHEGGYSDEHWVEYRLYPTNEVTKADLIGLGEKVKELCTELAPKYVWHRQPFRLSVAPAVHGQQPCPHLAGRTVVGDNINDEWLIIYLLLEATRRSAEHTEPGWTTELIAHVEDQDGDPLLIELAMVIPQWLDPSNSAWRVWVKAGKMHLVPIDPFHRDGLSAESGLYAVLASPTDTLAHEVLQAAFQKRMSSYPEQASKDLHCVRAILPRKVAYLLRRYSWMVSEAVHAYVSAESDPVDLRSARDMPRLGRIGSDEPVELRVVMTRLLYAMLSKHAGPLWEDEQIDALEREWRGDKSKQTVVLDRDSNDAALRLGAKLSMGIEIAWERSARKERENSVADAFYLNALSSGECCLCDQLDSVIGPSGSALDEVAAAKFERVMEPDDDSSWLDVDPQEIEDMMRNKYGFAGIDQLDDDADDDMSEDGSQIEGEEGKQEQDAADAGAARAHREMESISRGMSTFIEDMRSGLEGVEVPSTSQSLQFDPERFMKILAGEDGNGMDGEESESSAAGDEDSDDDQSREPRYDTSAEDQAFLQQYISAMQEELDEHVQVESVDRLRREAVDQLDRAKGIGPLPFCSDDEVDSDDEIEIGTAPDPAEIDFNLIQNLLKSFESQGGEAGPASTMLREMGIGIPSSWKK